ncbi:MAG: hypothetical protein PSV13_12195 [Lacunisphaera sp.]|nr:hypothetical protein [Lacunisphaera sp.]
MNLDSIKPFGIFTLSAMNLRLLAVLTLLIAFTSFARADAPKSKFEPASASELKIINQFSDLLFGLIQRKDVKGYVDLYATPTDRFRNVRTGKAANIPVNLDADEKQDLPKQFLALAAKIEKTVGASGEIALNGTEYSIRRDPHDKELGLFVFDVTLVLEGNGKIMRVWQPACVLGMRGVIIGDGPVVRNSSDL